MDFIKNILGKTEVQPDEHPQVRPIVTSSEGKIWLEVLVHVENIGDTKALHDQHLLSFPGQRIEGLQILSTIPEVEIKYFAHVESDGDTAWSSGNFVGTRGKSRRLEGIAVKLEGSGSQVYDVRYYVQMNGIEKSRVCTNGEFAGSRGECRRIEGLAIWLEPKKNSILRKGIEEIPYTSYNIESSEGSDDIEGQYHIRRLRGSDINEHIPTLYEYARECSAIAEFGVRSVVSTWAFLRGLRDSKETPSKKLICVDLEENNNIKPALAAAKKNDITMEFILGNDLSVNLKEGVDLLFIDTWHVYPQLKLELEIHSPHVRKYIAMHDTTVDGEKGESVRCSLDVKAQAKASGFSEADIKTGLSKAIKEFLETHHHWRTRAVFTNNNGLTVLERIGPNPTY